MDNKKVYKKPELIELGLVVKETKTTKPGNSADNPGADKNKYPGS